MPEVWRRGLTARVAEAVLVLKLVLKLSLGRLWVLPLCQKLWAGMLGVQHLFKYGCLGLNNCGDIGELTDL